MKIEALMQIRKETQTKVNQIMLPLSHSEVQNVDTEVNEETARSEEREEGVG